MKTDISLLLVYSSFFEQFIFCTLKPKLYNDSKRLDNLETQERVGKMNFIFDVI
jgi:hypothetical protein